jgi:hypothetical protein
MKQFIELLGLKVQDRVTGFQGVVVSVSFDLYGCVQCVVSPLASVEKPGELGECRWFDEKRLLVTDAKPVMEIPTFEKIPGPAKKPAFPSAPAKNF